MGQRIFGPAAEGREPLFQLKALAVGALDLGGVSLVSADPNGGQAAVIGVLAVVRAVVDGAADALIGGALAAAGGAGLPDLFLSSAKNFGLRRQVVCPRT